MAYPIPILIATLGVIFVALAAASAVLLRRRSRSPRGLNVPLARNRKAGAKVPIVHLNPLEDDEDDDESHPKDSCPAVPVAFDSEALDDEPTAVTPLFELDAVARTDRGKKRPNNEDAVLARGPEGLCVVADGMGGHGGGEIASKLAVETIAEVLENRTFAGKAHATLPPRAGELARAIQMASSRIHDRARKDPLLVKMGTTIVAARFSPKKGRVYVGHVGDSRCYRFREGALTQMTTDHTMANFGVGGTGGDLLARAVGPRAHVLTDVIVAKPRIGDVYLLCSDGLTKAVPDALIRDILDMYWELGRAADRLIDLANKRGGPDNVSVVIVRIGVTSEAAS
jgi:protein phosphatase